MKLMNDGFLSIPVYVFDVNEPQRINIISVIADKVTFKHCCTDVVHVLQRLALQ